MYNYIYIFIYIYMYLCTYIYLYIYYVFVAYRHALMCLTYILRSAQSRKSQGFIAKHPRNIGLWVCCKRSLKNRALTLQKSTTSIWCVAKQTTGQSEWKVTSPVRLEECTDTIKTDMHFVLDSLDMPRGATEDVLIQIYVYEEVLAHV